MTEPRPEFEIRFPSRESDILLAAERVLSALEKAGFVGRGAPRLKLALIELLANAVEHGNQFDEGRLVRVSARLGAEVARVSVADEGPGLDPRVLDRDLETIAITSKRGRGMSIVKRIMGARPTLSDAGNEVTIEFDRGLFG